MMIVCFVITSYWQDVKLLISIVNRPSESPAAKRVRSKNQLAEAGRTSRRSRVSVQQGWV